ncbi:MAG: hypothetical protein JNM84_28550 [Planctomycetes bacterium]|nr:hypothetical protein [Planctomycetota bacterium]
MTCLSSLRKLALLGSSLVLTTSAWAFQQPIGTSVVGTTPTTGEVMNAPEIDPTLATGLIVLLLGGVLILTSRVRSARATA